MIENIQYVTKNYGKAFLFFLALMVSAYLLSLCIPRDLPIFNKISASCYPAATLLFLTAGLGKLELGKRTPSGESPLEKIDFCFFWGLFALGGFLSFLGLFMQYI